MGVAGYYTGMNMSPTSPYKILCLHGYSMNQAWMQRWLVPLQAALGESYQLVCPQAPVPCPEDEVRRVWARIGAELPPERVGPGLNWAWYRATESTPPHYQFIEQSEALLQQLIETEGPFAGLIGWSQGTVMVTALLMAQPQAFRWAMFAGGALPADPRYVAQLPEAFAIPSLHLIGQQETPFMRRRSEALAARFHGAQVEYPEVGHSWPLRSARYLAKTVRWIGSMP